MNQKTTIGLVAALLIAVIGVWYVQSKDSQPKEEPKNEPKALFDPALGDLTAFEIKAGDEQACSFVHEEGKWRMIKPIAGSTQTFNVDNDARKIKELKYVKAFKKDDPERPSDKLTGMAAPQRIAKLTDKDGKSAVVKIGSTQQLAARTYVQKEGDDTIYVVDEDLNLALRRKLKDYRGTRMLEFAQPDAVKIEVSGAQNYTLAKGTDGKWTLESPIKARADMPKVTSLLTSLSSLTAQEFVENPANTLRPYGLEPPHLTIAVTVEKKTPKPPPPPPASAPAEPEFDVTQSTYRVAFGSEADEKVFARLIEDGSTSIFQIAKSTLNNLNPALADLRDKKITLADTTKAQKIKVTSAGGTTELAREAGMWKFVTPPAGSQSRDTEYLAVDDLLKAVRDLQAMGYEVDAAGDYGFTAPASTVEITVEGMVEPVQLVVGKKTPSQTGVYIKNVREDAVAVVKPESAEALTVAPMAFLSRELQRFNKADANRIELARGDRGCTISKEGTAWNFAAPISATADAAAVNNILTDLSLLRGKKVVGPASDAAKYGLDKPAISATVTVQPPAPPKPASQPTSDAASQPAEPEPPLPPPVVHTVLIGRPATGGAYAMVQGGATVCEIDQKVFDDLDAELLDTKVATVDASKMTGLKYAGTSRFELQKTGDKWALVGEASFGIDDAKVRAVGDALRDLRAKRYVKYAGADPKAYGLDAPADTVTVTSDDGSVVELRISSKGEGTDKYASAAQADRVFLIKAEDVAKLVKPIKEFGKAG